MDQLLRLLRAKCVYCGHLKMHPAKVNLVTCKLRLLQHGLLEEVEELENVGTKTKGMKNLPGGAAAEASAGSEDDSEDDMDLKEVRSLFTKRAIKKASGNMRRYEMSNEKVEALSEQRRAVIKQFLGEFTSGGACGHCNG